MAHRRWGFVAGSRRKKLCQKPLAARLNGILNYDMAISDTPDRTFVLERNCGVCVGKQTYFGTTRADTTMRGSRVGVYCQSTGVTIWASTPYSYTHSPNEKSSLADCRRGIKAIVRLWSELTDV